MPDPCDCPVFSFHDILERLDTAQRMFPKDQENPNEGGWQENSSRRRVDRAHSRLRFKRSTYLSGNAALTKGIYVVAMGWRCAYLVDTVGIKKEQLEILGGCFGSNASLQHIAFLFEETFEQVYVINIPIFKARATTLQTFCHTKSLSNAEMLWVQVDQGLPSMVCEMPMSLRVQILKHFDLNRNIAVPIPSGGLSEETSPGLMRIKVNRTDLPSLSAWILEYSVGYTFSQNIPVQAGETARRRNGDAKEKVSGTGKTNLDGEPLVLIKVKISGVKALGDK
ncbi:hypothetical protein NliqN6_5028 [Naganishia liquefaciens]|uniref:Uncharacterized protein n=1 Tax=Naganishia liquefaciens TaxID=104408 RepID=A0A8H3TXB9_9TREE|nr:hypothetical protein NliqN6_5028 [Naganishia liquefaciens]